MMRAFAMTLSLLALVACQSGETPENLPGAADDTQPFAGIAEGARINFAGTEPFWGGHVQGEQLFWTTPDNSEGTSVRVERFAGRGGLSYSGELDGELFTIAITPGNCSDGMSDRIYPFVTTATLGDLLLTGCAWRDEDDLGPPP